MLYPYNISFMCKGLLLRIRLNNDYIVIEIESNSYYLSLISSNLESVNNNQLKKEDFLKTVYYLCAKKARKQNLEFLKRLLDSSTKEIKIDIKKSLHVESKDTLKNHYSLLNSSEKDSLHIIRQRYLKLAKIYHPDRVAHKNKNLVKEYTTKFQKIQRAYETLKYKTAS